LTDREASVLDVLMDMHQAGERELVERTGLQRAVLARALRRLVELKYATKATEADRAIYRHNDNASTE
jgi:DNA-binding IclR family transcriptional regulator